MTKRRTPSKRTCFVEREFTVSRGSISSLTVRLYSPIRGANGAFECSYEIESRSELLRQSKIYGEDGVQALLLALGIVVVAVEGVLRSVNGQIAAAELRDLRRFRLPKKR